MELNIFDRIADRQVMGEIMFRLTDGTWWNTQELAKITKMETHHVYDILCEYESRGMVEKKVITVRPDRGKVIVGTHKLCVWRITEHVKANR